MIIVDDVIRMVISVSSFIGSGRLIVWLIN